MAGEFKCNLMGFASSSTESAKYHTNMKMYRYLCSFEHLSSTSLLNPAPLVLVHCSVYLRPVSGDWFMFVHKFIERDNKENQFSKSESIRDG